MSPKKGKLQPPPPSHTARAGNGGRARRASKAAPARDVIAILSSDNARILKERPELTRIKFERMSRSPFVFLRGSNGLFAADMTRQERVPVRVLLQGDAHLMNTGAYQTVDDEVRYFLNDFDDAILGPFDWDVRRMAVSMLLAAHEVKFTAKQAAAGVAAFLEAYDDYLEMLSKKSGKALTKSPALVSKPIAQILKKAQARTHAQLLDHWTSYDPQRGRTFKQLPGQLHPVNQAERKLIDAGMPEYLRSIPPELRHDPSFYDVLDVAGRLSGTGSIGNRNYYVLVRGRGRRSDDDVILQFKEEPPASYAAALHARNVGDQAGRVAAAQRMLQPQADRFVGHATVRGVPYYVRRIWPARVGMDLPYLKDGKQYDAFGADLGRILALGHARGGHAAAVSEYCHTHDLMKQIPDFAHHYAAQVQQDYKIFVEALARAPKEGAPMLR